MQCRCGCTERPIQIYNNISEWVNQFNGMLLKVPSSETQPVNQNLTRKYDIHFNFFLTKPTNEIIYNHTLAISTIDFKDRVILADSNEYLKRYYFLKNSLDKDEIFDRINLLAQFYGGAVILRYEYPLMILTKTKPIFLKRLKRMKKILAEEGSSDESKSNNDQKAVSINSSQFLRSVSSGQLQRKSMDQTNHLQLDFSLFDNEDQEVHDIFGQNDQTQPIQNSVFLSNINKLTREIACQLILEPEQNEEELKHLTLDFDQYDKEEVIRLYQKILDKQNRSTPMSKNALHRKQSLKSSKNNPMVQTQRIKQLIEKKPMTSSITITALEDQNPLEYVSPLQKPDNFKKKSLMSPRMSQIPGSKPQIAPSMKRSSYYQYQMEHNNFPLSNQFVINEDQMEDSPKNANYRKPQKFMNYQQKQRQPFITSRSGASQERMYRREQGLGQPSPITKYSSILTGNELKSRSKIFSGMEENEIMTPISARLDYQYGKQFYGGGFESARYPQTSHTPGNRMTSINININNLEEKKEQHRVNVKLNNQYKNDLGEEFAQQERNYRAEKKRKIREKAAALLNRVKSQQYMRTGQQLKQFQYGQQQRGAYFDRYYN